MNEGAGLSDPSRLSDQFGWSAEQLVSRYVILGCLCLLALALAYLLGLDVSNYQSRPKPKV